MLRIGIRIPGCQLDRNIRPFIENLELAHDVGYKAIEICPEDFDAIRTGVLDRNIASKLSEILEDYNFEISVHVPIALNLMNSEFPALHRQVLSCCLEFTSEIGGDLMVYHPGRYIDNLEFGRFGKVDMSGTDMESLIEMETVVLKDAAKSFPNIMIAVENLRPYVRHSPYSYGEFPERIAEFILKIGLTNVRMMVDTGHLNLSARFHGFNAIKSVLQTGLEPVHLHINDNHGIATFYTEKDKKGQLPFGRGDEHIPPGYGTFDFREFLCAFPAFDGRAIIELTEHWFYPVKIRESFYYLSSIVNHRTTTSNSKKTINKT